MCTIHTCDGKEDGLWGLSDVAEYVPTSHMYNAKQKVGLLGENVTLDQTKMVFVSRFRKTTAFGHAVRPPITPIHICISRAAPFIFFNDLLSSPPLVCFSPPLRSLFFPLLFCFSSFSLFFLGFVTTFAAPTTFHLLYHPYRVISQFPDPFPWPAPTGVNTWIFGAAMSLPYTASAYPPQPNYNPTGDGGGGGTGIYNTQPVCLLFPLFF